MVSFYILKRDLHAILFMILDHCCNFCALRSCSTLNSIDSYCISHDFFFFFHLFVFLFHFHFIHLNEMVINHDVFQVYYSKIELKALLS